MAFSVAKFLRGGSFLPAVKGQVFAKVLLFDVVPIVENARQSHTWQWASGHVRSRSEECM